jgi:hypothetical protein
MKLLIATLLIFAGPGKVGEVLTGKTAFQDYTTERPGQ